MCCADANLGELRTQRCAPLWAGGVCARSDHAAPYIQVSPGTTGISDARLGARGSPTTRRGSMSWVGLLPTLRWVIGGGQSVVFQMWFAGFSNKRQ